MGLFILYLPWPMGAWGSGRIQQKTLFRNGVTALDSTVSWDRAHTLVLLWGSDFTLTALRYFDDAYILPFLLSKHVLFVTGGSTWTFTMRRAYLWFDLTPFLASLFYPPHFRVWGSRCSDLVHTINSSSLIQRTTNELQLHCNWGKSRENENP